MYVQDLFKGFRGVMETEETTVKGYWQDYRPLFSSYGNCWCFTLPQFAGISDIRLKFLEEGPMVSTKVRFVSYSHKVIFKCYVKDIRRFLALYGYKRVFLSLNNKDKLSTVWIKGSSLTNTRVISYLGAYTPGHIIIREDGLIVFKVYSIDCEEYKQHVYDIP